MSQQPDFASEQEPEVPITDAYDDGYQARIEGDPVESNPELPGSDEFAAWRTAWLMADEMERVYPDDPVEDLISEVAATVRRQELGLEELVERIAKKATKLANMLAIGAPASVLDEYFRPSLQRAVDDLLERAPSRAEGAS